MTDTRHIFSIEIDVEIKNPKDLFEYTLKASRKNNYIDTSLLVNKQVIEEEFGTEENPKIFNCLTYLFSTIEPYPGTALCLKERLVTQISDYKI